MLPSAIRSGDAMTRRGWFGLAAVAASGYILPAGRANAARADQPRRDASGRFWAIGFQGRGVAREFTGFLAIDPTDGTWRKVADFPEGDGQVTPYMARVSPDRRAVAFPRSVGLGGDVWVLDLQGGGKPRRVFDRFGIPSWSGDGRRLVIATMKNILARSGFQAWQVEADGTNRTLLPLGDGDVVLDWSADGKWLLAASSRDMDKVESSYTYWPVYVMRPDGSGARRLIDAIVPPGPNAAPLIRTRRFSPDGRLVTFNHRDFARDESSVWVVGRDGAGRRRLVPPDGTRYSEAWCSPDGSRLAVVAGDFERDEKGKAVPTGTPYLVLTDLDGGHRRTIALPTFRLSIIDWR
jgi:Tol biopolymer transport system component